jgi:thiamine biosynthesis lipoprotein
MRRLAIVTVLLLAGADAVPAEPPRRFQFTEPHMGTRFQIILYAADEPMAHKASQAAFARIAALDAMLSDYRPTSELMHLCSKAGGPPVAVSPELFFVLAKAEEVSRLSDGAFDVTVGPVVRLWRLARRTQQLPAAEELAQARVLVGWQNVRLDAAKRTVQLLKPGMRLDLGGIAKGYAGDEAQRVLQAYGITRALVAAGGDIVVNDPPPGTTGWKVAIQPVDPAKDQNAPDLLLKNAAVSTSGDLQQYVEIAGVRYSHIVDPKTGLGLVGRMTATVIAPTGIQADSLTKPLAVLGPAKGLKLLDGLLGVSGRYARLVDGKTETAVSSRFPKEEK